MNPYMMQNLAAARGRELRKQAAGVRRARLARRARRGTAARLPGI